MSELVEVGTVNLLYKLKRKVRNKTGLSNKFNSFHINTAASNVAVGLVIFCFLCFFSLFICLSYNEKNH